MHVTVVEGQLESHAFSLRPSDCAFLRSGDKDAFARSSKRSKTSDYVDLAEDD